MTLFYDFATLRTASPLSLSQTILRFFDWDEMNTCNVEILVGCRFEENVHPPTHIHTHTWYNGETLNTDWIFDDIKKYKLLVFFFFRNLWLFLETGSLTFSFGDRLSIRDMLSNVNDKMPWGLLQNKCDGRQGNVGWVMRKHDRLWVEKC